MEQSQKEKGGYSGYIDRRHLTHKEVDMYRQKLAELDEAAHQPGGDLHRCPSKLADMYALWNKTGRQIYGSYTDDELLDIYLKGVQRRDGHTVIELYCVYEKYICARFGNLEKAKKRAKARNTVSRQSVQYPPDWHEHLSVEAAIDYLEKKGKHPSAQDIAKLEEVRVNVQSTGFPPKLTAEDKKKLSICGVNFAVLLRAMGIPLLSPSALKAMEKYWIEERQKAASEP